MWTPFTFRRDDWNLALAPPSSPLSPSDAVKEAYELRLLRLLLPPLLGAIPQAVRKRERPDFEIVTATGALFVEIVDAVPDAVSASGTMNLAQRRSRTNLERYRVDRAQFGAVIARVIDGKRRKASLWLHGEPKLQGKLVLLVNGGQGPLGLRHYFPDVDSLKKHAALTAIDPFIALALGDETGAFLARASASAALPTT
jgi:hypothetical protein